MNRTKIEWCDYTWNPVTGCKHGCSYCYARKMANRFKTIFPNGFEPTFYPERLEEPYKLKKPSMIFVCSMADLFGNWVPAKWIEAIIRVAEDNPHHIFQFLTKNPVRCREFSFPKNCWLGVTVTSYKDQDRILELPRWEDNGRTINFVSFEPLLGEVYLDGWIWGYIDWVIIGAQTNPYRPPKMEWVAEIIKKAREHGVPIFLKDNLRWPIIHREFPVLDEDVGEGG